MASQIISKYTIQHTLHPRPLGLCRPVHPWSLSVSLPPLIRTITLRRFGCRILHLVIGSPSVNLSLFPLREHTGQFDVSEVFALLRFGPRDFVSEACLVRLLLIC